MKGFTSERHSGVCCPNGAIDMTVEKLGKDAGVAVCKFVMHMMHGQIALCLLEWCDGMGKLHPSCWAVDGMTNLMIRLWG